MLVPGERVTVYGGPGGENPLLISSAQRGRAFLGTMKARSTVQPGPVTPLDEKVSGATLVDWAAFQPWEYRPDAGFAEGTDLIGYTVVAVDGDVGHVEATYDSRPAYLEVKAWSFFGGREVMLPAGLVERIGSAEKKVYVDRTRDQIKDAPRYDQAPADYWERLGSYYSGTYMPPGDQPRQLNRDSSSR